MKLADWLKTNNVRKYVFADRIGVAPSVVGDYCADRLWPGKGRMQAIVRETGGAVTANDFLTLTHQEPTMTESDSIAGRQRLQSATAAHSDRNPPANPVAQGRVPEDFKWSGDDVVIQPQAAIAVYWNANSALVIRQECDQFGEDDHFVYVAPHNLPALIERLQAELRGAQSAPGRK